MSIGQFLKLLSQQILVGIILVGRLGVTRTRARARAARRAQSPPTSADVLHVQVHQEALQQPHLGRGKQEVLTVTQGGSEKGGSYPNITSTSPNNDCYAT